MSEDITITSEDVSRCEARIRKIDDEISALSKERANLYRWLKAARTLGMTVTDDGPADDGSIASTIRRIIRQNPGGIKLQELLSAAKEIHPEVDDGNYVYTVISRLHAAGRIFKRKKHVYPTQTFSEKEPNHE